MALKHTYKFSFKTCDNFSYKDKTVLGRIYSKASKNWCWISCILPVYVEKISPSFTGQFQILFLIRSKVLKPNATIFTLY